VPFSPNFTPAQILSESGEIWLIGSTSSLGQPQNCGIEEVDPTSLHHRTFPLSQCATYVAAGGGHIYLLGDTFVRATDTDEFHLESFDLSTGQSTVMAPVIVTTNGTGRAHMAMAYGDGWVWVYPWADEVLQVSPTTGAVDSVVHGVGASGSGHPFVTVIGSGAYFAGGTPTITHTDGSTGRVDTFYRAPRNGQVIWISGLSEGIWASVSTFNTRGVPTTDLYALDASGHPTLKVREQPHDNPPVVSAAGRVFSVGGGCERPLQLWAVDVRTRRAAALTTLPLPA
jgi:outer membrane protein assembly factor BamB